MGSTGRRQLISQIHQREPLVGRRTRIVVAVDQYRSPTDRLIRRAHAQIAIAVRIAFVHLHGRRVHRKHAGKFHQINTRRLSRHAIYAACAVGVAQQRWNVGGRRGLVRQQIRRAQLLFSILHAKRKVGNEIYYKPLIRRLSPAGGLAMIALRRAINLHHGVPQMLQFAFYCRKNCPITPSR